ncbi:MAG: hypothetical protein WCA29_14535 [Jiangellales bacterium]
MRRIPLQVAEIVVLLAALVVGLTSGGQRPQIELLDGTPALAAHVDEALALFTTHGLEAPAVSSITFDADDPFCERHGGRFTASTAAILVCFDADTVVLGPDQMLRKHEQWLLLHELAHAWTQTHTSAEQRATFTALVGADSWNNHDDRWHRQANEIAAETFVWALTDGQLTSPTIASHNPLTLRAGFDLLTAIRD